MNRREFVKNLALTPLLGFLGLKKINIPESGYVEKAKESRYFNGFIPTKPIGKITANGGTGGSDLTKEARDLFEQGWQYITIVNDSYPTCARCGKPDFFISCDIGKKSSSAIKCWHCKKPLQKRT
jgi:hypothetical protein